MALGSLTGLKAALKLVWRGTLVGIAAAGLIAVGDGLVGRGAHFGLRTGLIGTATGGMLLLLALGMATGSYFLAVRGRSPELRRRLLAEAIWLGAAGMACGLTAAVLWLAVGHPVKV